MAQRRSQVQDVSNRHSVFAEQSSMPKELLERCQQVFAKYDKDNSGEIDKYELQEAMEGIFCN